MRLKTLSVGIILSATLALSGCSEMFMLHNTRYPDAYENKAVTAAEEFLTSRYGEILEERYGSDALNSLGFATTKLGDDYITIVRYTFDGNTVRVWNSLTNPITDMDYVLYAHEAEEKMSELAKPIFGNLIETVQAPVGYYQTANDSPCVDVDDFLSRENSYIYLMAVADDIPDKTRLVETFQAKLQEAGIKASFGLYFYTQYDTMLKDFQASKAINGYGDFEDWVFCMDCDQEIELRGKGIAYRQSSK